MNQSIWHSRQIEHLFDVLFTGPLLVDEDEETDILSSVDDLSTDLGATGSEVTQRDLGYGARHVNVKGELRLIQWRGRTAGEMLVQPLRLPIAGFRRSPTSRRLYVRHTTVSHIPKQVLVLVSYPDPAMFAAAISTRRAASAPSRGTSKSSGSLGGGSGSKTSNKSPSEGCCGQRDAYT